MRLTHCLVLTTLGIVAKVNSEPEADPLMVKAHLAVKIKSGSTDPLGKTGGNRLSRSEDECEKAADWERDGQNEKEMYSYCAHKGSLDSFGQDDMEIVKLESGNYVQAAFDKRQNTLKIHYVYTKACDPKTKDCTCKSLLDRVIKKFDTASEMALEFTARPPIFGCNCYLGTAARNDYTSVWVKKCNDVVDFDINNYREICKALIGRKGECW